MPKLDLVARATASSRRTGSAFQEAPPRFVPDVVISIDPGARNCGMAWFAAPEPVGPGGGGGSWPPGPLRDNDPLPWPCLEARTVDPWECLALIQRQVLLPGATVFVIEEYRLYPDKLQQQGFSSVGTSEVIGAIKWFVMAQEEPERFGVVMQSAGIKDAGCRRLGGDCHRLPRQGLTHDRDVHVGSNIHSRDAESHGVYWTRVKLPKIGRRSKVIA